MKKIKLSVLILAMLIFTSLLLSCNAVTSDNSTIGHNYYPELNQFIVSVTDDPSSTKAFAADPFPPPVQGIFVNQEVVIDKRASNSPALVVEKTAYVFNTVTDEKVYLLITKGVADSINLIPGETYQIEYSIIHGWPHVYRLIISKENEFVFAGISDGPIDHSVLSLNGLIPITASQSRILTENYIISDKDTFWDRMTNVEITFTIDGSAVNLHQGQSAILGNYEITLLYAREIKYKPNVLDAGQNSISYVINKK